MDRFADLIRAGTFSLLLLLFGASSLLAEEAPSKDPPESSDEERSNEETSNEEMSNEKTSNEGEQEDAAPPSGEPTDSPAEGTAASPPVEGETPSATESTQSPSDTGVEAPVAEGEGTETTGEVEIPAEPATETEPSEVTEEPSAEPVEQAAALDLSAPTTSSKSEVGVTLVSTVSSTKTRPTSTTECSSSDRLQGICDQVTETAKNYRVMTRLQYRMLTVVDDTPLNDNQLRYILGGEYDLPVEGLYVSTWWGLVRDFVKVGDQSTVRMLNASVGVGYNHDVSLSRTGWDRDINFYHTFDFYLPTSRVNPGEQDLYLGFDWLTAIRLRVVHRMTMGFNLGMGYDFMEHNGPPGPGAGQYDRLKFNGAFVIQEGIIAHPRWGSLVVRGIVGLSYILSYPSTQEYEAEMSDQNIWRQEYFWGLRLSYTPIRYVSIDIGLEHGTPVDGIDVLREGVAQTADGIRDELELVFSLWGRY